MTLMSVAAMAPVRLAAPMPVMVSAALRWSRVVSMMPMLMAMIVVMVAVVGAWCIHGRGNVDGWRCVAEGATAKARYIHIVVPAVIDEIHHPVASAV